MRTVAYNGPAPFPVSWASQGGREMSTLKRVLIALASLVVTLGVFSGGIATGAWWVTREEIALEDEEPIEIVYDASGIGPGISDFLLVPGEHRIRLQVTGNVDARFGRPTVVSVQCRGLEPRLLVAEVAEEWIQEKMIRILDRFVSCEVGAAQGAEWEITFLPG